MFNGGINFHSKCRYDWDVL